MDNLNRKFSLEIFDLKKELGEKEKMIIKLKKFCSEVGTPTKTPIKCKKINDSLSKLPYGAGALSNEISVLKIRLEQNKLKLNTLKNDITDKDKMIAEMETNAVILKTSIKQRQVYRRHETTAKFSKLSIKSKRLRY